MTIFTLILAIANLLLFLSKASSIDTLTLSQSLPDGTTLVSKDETFELGFFSLRNSTNRYLGIWFKNIPVKTVVWVANRDYPLKDNSTKLIITNDGNLVLLTKNNKVQWSTNTTTKASRPILQLLNTGNLVLRNDNEDNKNNNKSSNNNNEDRFLWQSFDYPSDTLLPGMKLGWYRKTGLNRRVIAWKNWDDPSPGNFSWGITFDSNPEMVLWKGSFKYHRSGPWNGIRFSGAFGGSNSLTNKSVISIVVMNQTLLRRQRNIWIPENGTWRLFQTAPRDICDTYNPCGSYANCMVDSSPVCQCLEGFKPKSLDTMEQGCVRSEPWSCKVEGRDGFRKFVGLKFPDTTHSWINKSMTLEECKVKCWENCSCTAYANLDIRGAGSGCSIWFGDLIDLKVVSQSGQYLYIRMADSQTDAKDAHKKKELLLIGTIVPPIVLVILLAIFYSYKRKRKYEEENVSVVKKDEAGGQEDSMELPLFDLATLVNATNNFSPDNKLGQGGFGPVYKGVLAGGQEIAVKRLSRSSGQGLTEFKNEVILCAKLQHRNLVKAWKLWKEGIPGELIDNCLQDSCIISEALRCIHIGLLCLQHQPNDRPNMASVVVMLSSDNELTQPKEPGFLIDRVLIEEESQFRSQTSSSTNGVTISILAAR
ncbi:G-type lectin S-receptor-like serine/threonine-protein kinase [Glycine max]|nr:G-type lectin S-receptor-like serine/threonine-protein kinase [Glycine max]